MLSKWTRKSYTMQDVITLLDLLHTHRIQLKDEKGFAYANGDAVALGEVFISRNPINNRITLYHEYYGVCFALCTSEQQSHVIKGPNNFMRDLHKVFVRLHKIAQVA